MEPLDPPKNEGGSGHSKRRLSSILKAPRKSVRLPDPEQQENVDVCAKPAEKRNSRRVSFAPANDVLLFSKDVKNVSPARSPLQELMTPMLFFSKRVQLAVTENGIQQITGMETLLNAPIHASQQRDMVSFNAGSDLGEKTVMFSTDDAFMDMTHCHTINIASDADLVADISLQNSQILPTRGEKTVMATGDDGSMDKAVNTQSWSASLPTSRGQHVREEKKIIASVPSLDPGFESFLASLSKPSRPSANAVITRMTPPDGATSGEANNFKMKPQQADTDKENQPLSSIPAVLEKTRNASIALFPDDDVSMDMTKALTGRIQAFAEDDPFQCLFPSQEMYSQHDSRVSQAAERNKQQQSRKTLPSSISKDTSSLRNLSLRASLPGHQVKLGVTDEYRERTIMFTAGDDVMDMTQSHTVHIARGSKIDSASSLTERKTKGSSTNGLDLGFKNLLASPSKSNAQTIPPSAKTSRGLGETFKGYAACPKNEVSKGVTEARSGPSGSDDPFQFLFPTKDVNPSSVTVKTEKITSGQKKTKGLYEGAGLGTSLKPTKTKIQQNQVKFDSEDNQRERTVRFSADDGCMDETRSLTVNIVSDLELQSTQSFPTFGEKTVRFTACDAAMDMTQSHTVNIAAELSLQSLQSSDFLPQYGEKTVRFNANDATMDMTNCLTVNIASNEISESALSAVCGPSQGQVYPENEIRRKLNEGGEADVSMDMTEAHTGRILQIPATDAPPQCIPGSQLQHRGSANLKGLDTLLAASVRTKRQRHQVVFDSGDDRREKTIRFTSDKAAMDITRSLIATNIEPKTQEKEEVLPTKGEKTIRFTADDAAMDVTRSHTVNIATDSIQQSDQVADFLPCGEKTMRFSRNDAAMDITRSLTVNIATNFDPKAQQKPDVLPTCGEKTLRFSANETAMDTTRSHTVNIATNFEPQPQEMEAFLPTCGEKTMRFTANDAAMDVTKSHTFNIATNFQLQSHQMTDVLPSCGEKTLRFSANDAAMDETQCLTVNIASSSKSDLAKTNRKSNILTIQENSDFALFEKRRENEPNHQRRSRSSVAHTKLNIFQEQPTQSNDTDVLTAAFVSADTEKPSNKTMTEENIFMDITEAQTGQISSQTCTDEQPRDISCTQDMSPRQTEMTSQNNKAQGSSNRQDSLDSNDSDTWKEPEPRHQTQPLSQETESSPAAVDHDVDAAPPRKSRRMSLADLHSKVRRLSQLMNTAPDAATIDSCIAPLSEPEHNLNKSPKDKTKPPPEMQSEDETTPASSDENPQAPSYEEKPSPTIPTTPFNLKTTQLISRVSFSGVKAKLPHRIKPGEPKKGNSVGEHTRTMTRGVTNQLSTFDADVSDINDEELGSFEDMSETFDARTPQKTTLNLGPSLKFNMEPFQDDVFEQDFISAVSGKKRPLPEEENDMEEDEKRIKASTEIAGDVETEFQCHVDADVAVECEGNVTAAPSTDFSNISHTASRCEVTSESTFKHSLFESQLEEYANDVQKKFDDGTVTVLEFFKIFSIDFVIHNPRQSVFCARLLSDSDRTPMDVMKDRHIICPKQTVYKSDVLNLTEKVEGLKARMRDLDKPLRIVNRALWEEMRNSSEKELKSFGAKLKERNSLFRKTSKAQSHEMKEVLYLNLVQANLDEQQKLIGRIEEADQMIKSLDDCIHELETELAAVEEKDSEDTPSLKSSLQELQRVTEALADADRQLSELEMQKTKNSNKVTKLKVETKNLESRAAMLNMVNEWRVGERRDDFTVYTFLHETLHLQLEFDKSNENDAGNQSERKISHISFKLQLDDEKSQDHASLVHKLLSQYIHGQTSLVEKYPTSRHIPKLLHDVGLVVSRCRLLGEELRLLKTWGALKLDILSISCVDTQVHIVFSSLKKFTKFEVIFSTSLSNQLYVLQVQSFRNMIGSTTLEQIEELVASISPTKNLLTKIIKKIHENLLC
ncbi:kinetochore scaffold 1 isoform X1 [Xyrichtys novacula]|uniref:Kinetochore scaffold 1 isoform X1 n=1 Tax=Xyrichtys novacula TaxID=13765 RepID=A0AAV1GXS6_XYRNO|nr:kinetochore scaffold 1 isoform X1 [Xyrichtys novacula]